MAILEIIAEFITTYFYYGYIKMIFIETTIERKITTSIWGESYAGALYLITKEIKNICFEHYIINSFIFVPRYVF